jgi:hypothetical protein
MGRSVYFHLPPFYLARPDCEPVDFAAANLIGRFLEAIVHSPACFGGESSRGASGGLENPPKRLSGNGL